ncbi:prenyltransferase [Deinococcus psychrotolerans]|uniref:Prenyltransferase n=1 Tax=Deinococcus psychrotolerans TaxID=2489213 RepID=A0A3G8YKY5_9DEIO|nr:UbiA family prenyltransferase [Deinococcus psychrotolerans]AZI42231.1 prenyltransferase [Deinococcus psychrotolerans]
MSRLQPRSSAFNLLPLRQVLLVSRPALWVNTLGVAVTGLWLSGQLWNMSAGWLLLLVYLSLPFNLLIYGLNDFSDMAEDARSERKGGWQGARLRSGEENSLLWLILALNLPFLLALAWLLSPAAYGVLLLCAGLFAAYSLRPLRFKTRPFLDGLSNVAYALPLLIPALMVGAAVPALACAALCAYAVGKHAFDAVQDIPADADAHTRTVATTLGAPGAARYALAWFALAGALLWPLSPLSSSALWLVCGGMALRLLRRPTSEQAARLYPLSIVSPWIVGAVSGVQLVYVLAKG